MSLICEQSNLLVTLYKDKKAIISLYDTKGNYINTNLNTASTSELVINGHCFNILNNILQNSLFNSSHWDKLDRNGVINIESDIEFKEGVDQLLTPAYKLTLLRVNSSDSILQGYILIVEDISEQQMIILKNRAYMFFSNSLSFGKIITWKYDIKTGNVFLIYEGKFIIISFEELFEKIHPSDRKTFKDVIKLLVDGVEDRRLFLLRIKECNNSPYLYYRILLTAKLDYNNTIESIIGQQQDITDVIQGEKALEKAKNKMLTMNRQLKDVLALGKITPCLIDLKKGIVRISSNVRKDKFGPLTHNRFVMHIDECLSNIHPDDVDDVLQLLNDVMSLKRSEGVVRLRYDVRGQFKNHFLFAIMRYSDKSLDNNFIGYLQDITETELLIHKLIESKKKNEEGERIKSEFLSNISHEIRTPLNQILGFSELLAKSDNPEDRNIYYEVIQGSCTNFLKLINDIIKVSDVEINHSHRSMRTFDVSHLFLSLYNNYKDRIRSNEIDFRLDPIPNQTIVTLDRARIYDIMDNFLDNAFKYTEAGHISMGYGVENEKTLYIYVEDTGHGIAPENTKTIFNNFVKLHSFSQGLGLGLSICKHYVNAAKGTLGVESKPGKGSRFWARIPFEI